MDDEYEQQTSICPSCAVGCSLRYDQETGQASAPDDVSAIVNHEERLCSDGVQAFDGIDGEDRLTQPMIRRDGKLVATSWETAYNRIEHEIERILEQHGPDALAFLGSPRATNEENYLFQKFARGLGTNNIDNRARLCHNSVETAMTERLGSSAMTNSLADLPEADVFLVIGANPAEQQPIAFDSYIHPAIDNGATLIHIDPAENRTSQAADLSISPRPDTDAYVAALLNKYVLDAGYIDDQFIRERTEGFDGFAASVNSVDPDTYAATAGIDPADVREIAHSFGSAERAAIITATGIGDCDYGGTETTDALIDLLLLTGNIGKPGTGMNLFRGLTNEQGANDMGTRPHTLPGYRDVTDPEARAATAEIWGKEPPATPGRSELDLIQEFGDAVCGTYVFGENPAMTKTDPRRIARNFDAMDFIVVQDLIRTKTVEYADVVLPASDWTETSGTVTNLDRQVQRMHQLTTPPGEAKQDRHILCELGARLTDMDFAYDSPEAVFEEMQRINPLYAGMSYAKIERGGQRWPLRKKADTGTQILHREQFMTGNKRTRFVPISIE
jgi:predicted molibdopterin-dependent oxidoreductase YjgC